MNNIELIGDKVLILLDTQQDHTVNEVGIVVPKQEMYETEGGQYKTKISNDKYLRVGTVVQTATLAVTKLAEQNVSLNQGDRVYVNSQALSSSYHFPLDRSALVTDFNGYICIPHTLIEAKVNNVVK